MRTSKGYFSEFAIASQATSFIFSRNSKRSVFMLSRFSCVQFCDPKVCSLPESSVHGILQARILEWVAMPASRGSSWHRDQTHICGYCIAGGFFTAEPPGKPHLSQKTSEFNGSIVYISLSMTTPLQSFHINFVIVLRCCLQMIHFSSSDCANPFTCILRVIGTEIFDC